MPYSSFINDNVCRNLRECRLAAIETLGQYFRRFEIERQVTPYDLIEEFERDMQNCPKEPGSTSPWWQVSVNAQNDFPMWALYQRLFLFINRNILNDSRLVTEGNRQKLLEAAIFAEVDDSGERWRARLSILRTVLGLGASPNAKYIEGFSNPETTWTQLLAKIDGRKQGDFLEEPVGNQLEFDFAVAKILLSKGAEPNAMVRLSWLRRPRHVERMSAMDMLDDLFQPEQVTQLNACIEEYRKTKGRQASAENPVALR